MVVRCHVIGCNKVAKYYENCLPVCKKHVRNSECGKIFKRQNKERDRSLLKKAGIKK